MYRFGTFVVMQTGIISQKIEISLGVRHKDVNDSTFPLLSVEAHFNRRAVAYCDSAALMGQADVTPDSFLTIFRSVLRNFIDRR
jgi:hypothetical protein